MHRILGACLVALIICCLASCGSGSEGVPASAKGTDLEMVDVRGTITHMRQASAEMARDGIVGVILVEGAGQDNTRFDSADVNITAETRILTQGESHEVDFAHLTIGQQVEVQFDGTPKDGDPPLGGAKLIVIGPGTP